MAKDIRKFAHPEYIQALPDYKKIRDCFKGERSIKEAGTAYLPRLKAQSEEDYTNYLTRALFFPITGKTCTSMVGMATSKPPKAVYPSEMAKYFIDTEGAYQFTEFYVSIFTEVVLMGRYGVLIDAPALSQGDPILVPYIAENIINWDVDAEGKIIELLLRECHRVKGESKFESKFVTQYRHCYLLNGVYTVEVLDEDLELVPGLLTQPTFSGNTIDFIPYTPYGSSGVHMGVDKPPMLDITTINLSHYLTSADLEWGRHIVGLPTPVVSGVDTGTSLSIGGTKAWMLPTAEAKAYYLEFQGQGLQSLEKAMTDKVGLMASISARLVDISTRGSEAAETVRLRYMSESASLIHIISAIENGAMMMYNMLALLMKASDTVDVKFPREILGVGITFKDLAVMFEAYMNGILSKESLLYNLRRLDALDPNRTDAEELAAIKEPPKPESKPAATPPQNGA
jgi:hypothetical protein